MRNSAVPCLCVMLVAAFFACDRAPAEPPDVLLITVDTLRADALHTYGFPQPSTPQMDALAARGALFENAIAASSRTVPSHASIMVSRWVRAHSVRSFNGSTRLEGHPTLAERFREAGYDTAAFVSNFVLQRRSGLDAGFELYDDALDASEAVRGGYLERSAAQTTARAVAWLAARAERPFFLWVHYQDPHGPYQPPEPFHESLDPVEVRVVRALPVLERDSGRAGIPRYQAVDAERRPAVYARRYAEEVAYTDAEIGKLVAAFEGAGAADRDRVILLTADHGESLGESGFFFQHGERTSPDQVHVPFLVLAPTVRPARFTERVHHIDVAPTLLALAGLPPLGDAQGESLVARIEGGKPAAERILFSESAREITAYRGDTYLQARPGRGALRSDPLAPEGVLRWIGSRREDDGRWLAALPDPALKAALEAHLAQRTPSAAAVELDRIDEESLRALGYVPEVPQAVPPH